MKSTMPHHIPTVAALALSIASIALHVDTADAAVAAASSASAATQAYIRDRADCEAGRSQQDRATCLKEAGAADQERKRNGLKDAESASSNAKDRCNALPLKDKADCLTRIEGTTTRNKQVTTSGSVSGGGIIRETRTITVGPSAAVNAASEPAASASR